MMNPFEPKPVTLTGKLITLCPLSLEHADELYHAGHDEQIWRYMPVPMSKTVDETREWIASALQEQKTGLQIPFAVIWNASGKAIGSTRYLDIQISNHALEVGWTWIGAEFQRTGVNTECKYLILRHAFEALGAVRVQLKTDGRNTQSQTAIARIGAKHEGVLRKSRLVWDGVYRDTVYYSIVDTEWHDVKSRLEIMLTMQG